MRLVLSFVVLTICVNCLEGLNNEALSDSTRLNYFDTDLLRYTVENRNGNIMISPASLKTILGMLLEGASGETAAEIISAMRLSRNIIELRDQLSDYLTRLQVDKSGSYLQNTNGVFVSKSVSLKKDYETLLKRNYKTEVYKTDFSNPSYAAGMINDWVNKNTRGLISNIVDPGSIDTSANIFISNTLYFKSQWQHSFSTARTRPDCFRVLDKCRTVLMMDLHAELNYTYVKNLRAHAVELPYRDGRHSMILLIPRDPDGAIDLIRDLPYNSLPAISSKFELTSVDLLMPKFEVKYSEDMVKPLIKMRISSLFDQSSNLSGIFEGRSTRVSNIYHKVYMSVDEVGTVATAASGVFVVPLINNGVQLKVDRPFIFFIRDNSDGLVLFEGKIDEPTIYVDPQDDKQAITQNPSSLNSVAQSNANAFSDNIQAIFGPLASQPQPLAQVIPVQPSTVPPASNTQTSNSDTDPDSDFKQSTQDYDAFDLTITKRISLNSGGNFIMSPLGLKLALTIMTEAATGPTKNELLSVLGYSQNVADIREKFAVILESLLQRSGQNVLTLGSRICLEEQVEPRQKFAAVANHFYKTEFARVNFANPSLAAQNINNWVANITAGHIPDLVTPDDLTGVVVMILTALYFKGTWLHQFDIQDTMVGTFYAKNSARNLANFMNVKGYFYYAEAKAYDADIIRLPYIEEKIAMYLIVPKALDGLERAMELLSPRILKDQILLLNDRLVDLKLPRFKFDFTIALDDTLQEMGIRQAFTDAASFPGIARGKALPHRLKVSKVLQRSGIEVNERGSVAFSATEILLVNKFGESSGPIEIAADRPFLFFIQDEATRQILFTGQVTDPGVV